MRNLLLLAGLGLGLAACGATPAPAPTATTATTAAPATGSAALLATLEQIGCQTDAAAQPVAVASAALAGNIGLTAATVDQLLVHPLVLAACAKVGGVPVAITAPVTAAPLPAPTTPAVPPS